MEVKLSLILMMVAMAMVAEKAVSFPGGGLNHFNDRVANGAGGRGSVIGDFIGDENELLLDSEASRRALAGRSYIGYGALKANQVPCGRRGQSYYNCQKRQTANPYKRGCSAITRCARYTG